jgi:hypothetical protein
LQESNATLLHARTEPCFAPDQNPNYLCLHTPLRRLHKKRRAAVEHMDSRPEPGSSKAHQRLGLFIKSMRGEHPFGDPGCEYCAELSTVSQHLLDLSCGAHQWASLPSCDLGFSSKKRSRRYLVAGYSNPECGLPNPICFCIPLFIYRCAPGRELTHVVCFASQSAVPYQPVCIGNTGS